MLSGNLVIIMHSLTTNLHDFFLNRPWSSTLHHDYNCCSPERLLAYRHSQKLAAYFSIHTVFNYAIPLQKFHESVQRLKYKAVYPYKHAVFRFGFFFQANWTNESQLAEQVSSGAHRWGWPRRWARFRRRARWTWLRGSCWSPGGAGLPPTVAYCCLSVPWCVRICCRRLCCSALVASTLTRRCPGEKRDASAQYRKYVASSSSNSVQRKPPELIIASSRRRYGNSPTKHLVAVTFHWKVRTYSERSPMFVHHAGWNLPVLLLPQCWCS